MEIYLHRETPDRDSSVELTDESQDEDSPGEEGQPRGAHQEMEVLFGSDRLLEMLERGLPHCEWDIETFINRRGNVILNCSFMMPGLDHNEDEDSIKEKIETLLSEMPLVWERMPNSYEDDGYIYESYTGGVHRRKMFGFYPWLLDAPWYMCCDIREYDSKLNLLMTSNTCPAPVPVEKFYDAFETVHKDLTEAQRFFDETRPEP